MLTTRPNDTEIASLLLQMADAADYAADNNIAQEQNGENAARAREIAAVLNGDAHDAKMAQDEGDVAEQLGAEEAEREWREAEAERLRGLGR